MPELVDRTSSSTEPAKGVVLVALPAAGAPVYGIGPEEKHVTLVYLGKIDELPVNDSGAPWYTRDDVVDAVTRWLADPSAGGPLASNFSVATSDDGLQSLGDEGARVWMLDSPRLARFHNALLTVQAVGDLAAKTMQYPTYTPHMTIGYPTEGRTTLDPATEAAAEGIDAITFDRIALWWGDKRVEWPLTREGETVTEQASITHAQDLVEKRIADGTASADEIAHFLKLGTLQEAIHHAKEWTVQDVIDSLSPEQRDVFDIIVGASVDDEELDENEYLSEIYDSFNDEQEAALDLTVGLLLADPELEHSGVKGMKWGVRKGEIVNISGKGSSKSVSTVYTKAERAKLKSKVQAGKGTLLEAHMVALKSRGHRVTNAMLGDKTYWKRTGVTTAVTAAIAAAAIAAPGAAPAGVLYGALTGTSVAQQVNTINALARSIRGNARISNSANTHLMTLPISRRQTAGSQRVQKILQQNGSISKKVLTPAKTIKQSDNLIDKILKHAGILGMKWGVRRKPGPDGTVSSTLNKTQDSTSLSDGERARQSIKALKRGGVSALSNDDLRHLTSRLQLETQFSQVDRSKIGKLDTKVNKLLKYGSTMNRAIKFANSAAGQELSFLLRNKTAGSHAATPLKRLLPKAEEAAAAAAATRRAEALAKALK